MCLDCWKASALISFFRGEKKATVRWEKEGYVRVGGGERGGSGRSQPEVLLPEIIASGSVNRLHPIALWLHTHCRVHASPLQHLLPGKVLLEGHFQQILWLSKHKMPCGWLYPVGCSCVYVCWWGGGAVGSQCTFLRPCTLYTFPCPGSFPLIRVENG